MPRYSREPYNLNLYYPLLRKSGSVHPSFPAQMCNLSNSDHEECMGIALHHAGNKDINLPERNFTFYAKIPCKNMPQKVYVAKSEAKHITPKFGCKICPQKFTPLKLDAKNLVKYIVNSMQKPKPKFVGTKLMSRSHL